MSSINRYKLKFARSKRGFTLEEVQEQIRVIIASCEFMEITKEAAFLTNFFCGDGRNNKAK